jgi:Protein of unknown function (DUF1592)/Protein of unknown function (DUF1588)
MACTSVDDRILSFARHCKVTAMRHLLVLPLGLMASCTGFVAGGTSKEDPIVVAPPPPACRNDASHFAREVWPVLSASCLQCHTIDGVAIVEGKARFVLQRPNERGFLASNRASLAAMAIEDVASKNRLLLKVQGELKHGGGAILAPDSAEFAALSNFVERVRGVAEQCPSPGPNPFEGLTLKPFPETLRKVSLNLTGTLPAQSALSAVSDEASFDAELDKVFATPAFEAWVRESWNDVLKVGNGRLDLLRSPIYDSTESLDRYAMFLGLVMAADLTPPYFNNVRTQIEAARKGDETARLTGLQRIYTSDDAHREEPLRLISHVVANDLPFTEILTADYTVVNPWLAKLYEVPGSPAPTLANYEQWTVTRLTQSKQKYDGNLNPLADDPSRKDLVIHHAGVLSTPSFLTRWVTTPTNKSRSRVRVIAEAFLGLDIVRISQRQIVPSQITSVDNPARNVPACVTCHAVMDPLAGAFRNYGESDFLMVRRLPDGSAWHDEMFPPGYGTEQMPKSEYDKALPWMAKRLAADPRFAVTIAKQALKALTGSELLPFPKTDDVDGEAKFVAWQAQQDFINETAAQFKADNFSYKKLLKRVIKSAYYRAEASSIDDPRHAAFGRARLLTPEMLSRKLKAIFGVSMGTYVNRGYTDFYASKPFGNSFYDELVETDRLFFALGGSIFSKERNSERQHEVNPTIALVTDVVATNMSCRNVPADFARPKATRLAIRQNLVFLYQKLLGETHAVDDDEIAAAYAFFDETYKELKASGKTGLICQGLYEPQRFGIPYGAALPADQQIKTDDSFTIRAWSTVVHALLTDDRFLYE